MESGYLSMDYQTKAGEETQDREKKNNQNRNKKDKKRSITTSYRRHSTLPSVHYSDATYYRSWSIEPLSDQCTEYPESKPEERKTEKRDSEEKDTTKQSHTGSRPADCMKSITTSAGQATAQLKTEGLAIAEKGIRISSRPVSCGSGILDGISNSLPTSIPTIVTTQAGVSH